jgi:hypothetical protein
VMHSEWYNALLTKLSFEIRYIISLSMKCVDVIRIICFLSEMLSMWCLVRLEGGLEFIAYDGCHLQRREVDIVIYGPGALFVRK